MNLQILNILYKGKICSDYNLSSGVILQLINNVFFLLDVYTACQFF